jgi:Tol biopolymer transport system component
LICGNDDGAPNELRGCSIGLDGSYVDFGNDVRALTQPVLSPDRTRLAFAEPGGRIVLRAADGAAEQTLILNGLSGPLDWSADGTELLVSDRSALVVVDLVASRQQDRPALTRYELDSDVLGLAQFSPDATTLIVATKQADQNDQTYRVVLVKRSDGSLRSFGERTLPRNLSRFIGTFADPSFDTSGRRLAWADGMSGELSVLELASGEVRAVALAQPPELITGVSWSPSGLIAVGVAASLRLVDPENNMSISAPLPAEWSITASPPAWSADGARLITTVQHPGTEALLDLVEVDLAKRSVRLLTTSSTPPPPVSTFPGFPVWP